MKSPALVILFFLSGAIALVYEVVWHRQFALLLGSAAPATAAVLAAYFSGLGAGSYLIGRVADRWKNPLRAYAILEVLIAAGAVMTAIVFYTFDRVYPWVYSRLVEFPGLFFGGKLVIALLAILFPTFCMGGTLPVLGRFIDRGRHRLGTTAGLLYVLNTAGAGLGALSVPFLMLPWLGVDGTLALCIAGNLLLAAGAWVLSSRSAMNASPLPTEHPGGRVRGEGKGSLKPLLSLAFISGAATFALQVFWNRAFAQIHENSVHSFAVIVATVIVGLAMGAQFARSGLRRGLRPRTLIALGWLTAGVLIIVSPWLFLWLTGGLAYLNDDGGWVTVVARLMGLGTLVVAIPAMLAGIALPAILEEAGLKSSLPTSSLLGRILVVNIVGSIVGALVAGFAAPILMQLWQGIILLGLLLALAGIAAHVTATPRPRPERLLIPLLVAGATCVGGVRLIELPRVRVDASRGERLVSTAEGSHGIVAVTERSGSRRLKLNNHYLLGGTSSTGDERLQAHLPLLLHPAPRRVAFLGLGTGITAGGALFHPVERLTVAELVPEVVDAARAQFAGANAGLLNDPRTALVVDDARHLLRGSAGEFDVIVGDLVVPWRPGEGALFTLENFTAARAALAPGGWYCQWLPCFQLSELDLRTILRTFVSVFPETSVWRGDFSPTESAIALIAAKGGATPEPEVIRSRLRQLKPDPANAHLAHPAIVWMHLLGEVDRNELNEPAGPLNTDNRPVVELLGPLRRGREENKLLTGRRLQAVLKKVLNDGPPRQWQLPVEETVGVEAGARFQEMMLLLAEANAPGARDVRSQLKSTLPVEAFQLLFP